MASLIAEYKASERADYPTWGLEEQEKAAAPAAAGKQEKK